MRRSRRRGVAALGCCLTLCLTAIPGVRPGTADAAAGTGGAARIPSTALVVPPEPVAAPIVEAPRLAFTDDSDELAIESGSTCGSTGPPWDCDGDPDLLVPGARHAGEASTSGRGVVYVSDLEVATGEVYVRTIVNEAEPEPAIALNPQRRVTCDDAVETHPVLSPNGSKVAYASNAGGSWSVWVVWIDRPSGGDDLPCAELPRVEVADGTGSDLWPTWLGEGALAFSRSGPTQVDPLLDPLGDIYLAELGGRGEAVPADAAVQLTKGPAAETQPRAFRTDPGDEESAPEYAVAFTTTQFRPDGSLAGIGGLADGRLGLRTPSSLWPEEPVQSTEAVYLESESSARIGFTTTRDDPFGDVLRVDLRIVEAGADEFDLEADPESIVPVSAEPGRSESHLAFTEAYYNTDINAVYTRRSLNADVSDVVAADGSGRRTVAAGSIDDDGDLTPRDESTPTYSPDGTRIAYSRTAESGREIVTARERTEPTSERSSPPDRREPSTSSPRGPRTEPGSPSSDTPRRTRRTRARRSTSRPSPPAPTGS